MIIKSDTSSSTKEVVSMNAGRKITEAIGYLADAVAVIFSPYRKAVQEHLIGVQPFTGEIYDEES
jgi:hypothetical protein